MAVLYLMNYIVCGFFQQAQHSLNSPNCPENCLQTYSLLLNNGFQGILVRVKELEDLANDACAYWW